MAETKWHDGCFACGHNAHGLSLHCQRQVDGSVTGQFRPERWMQGYPDRLQGGIVATLLDSAMTQCIHMRGIDAVTGKLELRFTAPGPLDRVLTIKARIERMTGHGIIASAVLVDDQRELARAQGLFVPLASASTGATAKPCRHTEPANSLQ